jgi:TolB protein
VRRALPLLLIGLLVAVLVTGCGRAAEAVDTAPSQAERTRQTVQAGGKIAFIAAGQVWEWSGGAARPLTKPGVHYEGAAWSPDGKSIAVSEVGENHSDVFVLDAAGQRVRQITHNWSQVSVQDSAWARKPAWSPSGEQIAFVSDLYRTDMSLWLVGAQGSNPRRVQQLQRGSGGLDWPTWSPDGKKVAFATYPAGLYKPPQIFVLTLATGAMAQITEFKDGAFDPAWSPDGQSIAFAGRADGKTNVVVMKADGSQMVRLTDGRAERAPVWSPDGAELAYVALQGSSFDVAVVRLSGTAVSEPKMLTRNQNVDAISGLSWAP